MLYSVDVVITLFEDCWLLAAAVAFFDDDDGDDDQSVNER